MKDIVLPSSISNTSYEIYYVPEKNIWLIEQEENGVLNYFYLKDFEVLPIEDMNKQLGIFVYVSSIDGKIKVIDFNKKTIKQLDNTEMNDFSMDTVGNLYIRYHWKYKNLQHAPEKWGVTMPKSSYTKDTTKVLSTDLGDAWSLFQIKKGKLKDFLGLYTQELLKKF